MNGISPVKWKIAITKVWVLKENKFRPIYLVFSQMPHHCVGRDLHKRTLQLRSSEDYATRLLGMF